MNFNFTGDIDEIKQGLVTMADDLGYALNSAGLKVLVEKKPGCDITVIRKNDSINIMYSEKIHFFRALGLMLENIHSGNDFHITEHPQFKTNGAMFDISQGNAVIRVETIKDYIRKMAVMGLNMLMLYSEDSYDVKDEPYFGYMRGRYTNEELKECDDYAFALGVEMIPCIQTLAHLVDVLKWDVYSDIQDDPEALLVGEEKTYKFIEHLIVSASAPFRTKRIHIGMDEAWHLGLGAYLSKNGLRRKFDIMNEHMEKVLDIVKKYDLNPMIWSDMYFRAASNTGDYYDRKAFIPQDVIDAVPKGVELVYWDYYHDNEDFYIDFIQRHKQFGTEPIFAGGIWTWTGFCANWGKTFATTNPALKACKKEGVSEVFVTIWGDNGTESNVYSNLLGLQLFAEHGYSKELDINKLKKRFEFCTGCSFDDFISIKYLDEVPGTDKDNMSNYNPSKYLMWQDILTGLFDKNIEGLQLNNHYEKLTETLEAGISRNGRYGFIFEYLSKVSSVLSIKAELGIQLIKAYRQNDRAFLLNAVKYVLPELETRVKNLRACHKKQWFEINKAFGWDIMDMRYGSLLIRIQSAIEQIQDYLNGKLKNIEEFEEERLSYNGKEGLVIYANFYDRIVSSSRIAPRG